MNEPQPFTYFDLIADPQRVYQLMHQHPAIYWNEACGVWFVSRYQEARDLLRDPRLSAQTTKVLKSTVFPTRIRDSIQPLVDLFDSWMMFMDSPDHTQMRRIFNPYFGREALVMIEPKIREFSRDLLSACEGEWDFVEQFARPLPARIMADLIGIPNGDIPLFLEWNQALSVFIDAIVRTPTIVDAALSAMKNARAYFENLIEQALLDSQPNFLQQVYLTLQQHQAITETQYWRLIVMLLGTGTETTQGLLANGVFHLLSFPDQWRLLQQRPELLDSAISECLRYDPPVVSILRVATEAIATVGGTIEPGQYVRIVIGAIHQDPEQFNHPEQFDITRESNKQMAFGAGVHFCIGQLLARATARIALPELLTAFPDLHLLTRDAEYHSGVLLRSVKSFQVT